MTWLQSIDSAISSRVCFTLLNSLWQVAVLLLLAEGIAWLQPRPTAQKRYLVLVGALLLSLLALPLTYSMQNLEALPLQAEATSPAADMPVIGDAPYQTDSNVASSRPIIEASNVEPSASATGISTIARTPWMSWLLCIYASGVAIMMIRLAFGCIRNRRDRGRLQLVSSGCVHDHLHRLCERLRLPTAPLLAHSELVAIPKLVGLLRPVIVLPSAALRGFSAQEMEMILAHELSHLRRGDMWVHLVQKVAEAVLFFNPAIWMLSRRINRLREFCCDDVAYTATHCQPSAYARLLLRLAESAVADSRNRELTALASTGNGPSELRRRVARLLGEPVRSPMPFTRRNLVIAAATTLLAVAPLVWPMHAQTAGAAEDTEGTPSGSMTRQFKNGTVVELLGIGTRDRNAPKWWDDTGRAIEDMNVSWDDASGGHVASHRPLNRTVAIRIHGRPEESYLTWRLPGSGSWAGVNAPDDTFARHFAPSQEDSEEFSVMVGLAAGGWELVGSGSAGSGAAIGRNGHSLVFSRGFEVDGTAAVIVSHDYFDEDFRVVAYDIQGAMHPQQGRGGLSAGPIYQCQASFPGLSLDQIERFEFHTRNYEWVEFKDLPLDPK